MVYSLGQLRERSRKRALSSRGKSLLARSARKQASRKALLRTLKTRKNK